MTAGLSYEAADADAAALAAAGSLAEEALGLHCEALTLLEDGWSSQSSSAATQLLRQYRGEAAELVVALHVAAEEFRALRDMTECPTDPADPAIDQAVSRLQERPAARFNTPDPAMYGAAPAPQQPPAWASALPGPALAGPAGTPALPIPAVPDLGGALVGLVAQIADAVSPGPAGAGADLGSDASGDPLNRGASDSGTSDMAVDAKPDPPEAPRETPEPRTESSNPTSATSPGAVAPAYPPVQPPPALPPPSPPVDPPLLAAERPPVPHPVPDTPVAVEVPENADAHNPATSPATPCEIAASELPQVGQ